MLETKKIKTTAASVVFIFALLFCVRQKSHIPGALYRLGQQPLVLGARPGVEGIDNFRLVRNKPPQGFRLLIIDLLRSLGAEETLFTFHH